MKKFLLAIGLLFSISYSGYAQQYGEDGNELLVKCHTYEMMDKFLEDHPELRQSVEESTAQQEKFRSNFLKNYEKKDGEIYTIPVVFHIVHDNGVENISPEQIENAIEVMNRDFAAMANGIGLVHPAFTNLISNTGIRFALAKRDPDGNCTNGIVRTESQLTYEGSDNLKEVSPIWDRARYLNVWVCKIIESGAAGYSRYPAWVNGPGGEAIDGIVMRHDYVGSIGTSNSTKAHTLTHEAGHWLDLPHLWGSSNEPGLESNCDMDDGVSDTPNTIGWTTCNTLGESCGSLDNVQNFMEYSYCSKMFTHGQALRMVAALNSFIAERNQLWQESNLISTGVFEESVVCAAEFISDRRTICVGDSILFEDYSYSGILSRMWNFDGGSPSVSDATNPRITYNTPGLYTVSLTSGDSFTTESITEVNYIRVLDTSLVVVPFTESFEEIESFENGQSPVWYTESVGSDNAWQLTQQAAATGSHSAMIIGSHSEEGSRAHLLSQTFDMSSLGSSNAILSFKYSAKRRNWNSNDKLIVYVSRNCGEDWIPRKTLSGDNLYNVPGTQSTQFFPSNSNEWAEVEISNLVPVYFTSEFRIKFEYVSQSGSNVFIDDINLTSASTVSIDGIEAIENGVSIYPNPASDLVTIEMEMPVGSSNFEINLHDVSGRLIQGVYSGNGMVGKNKIDLDVNALPNGLYFLNFNTAEGNFAQKLVINK